jgi:hypothetical protein
MLTGPWTKQLTPMPELSYFKLATVAKTRTFLYVHAPAH